MKKRSLSEINEIVTEYDNAASGKIKDNSHILETALFIEETFGLILSDDDICLENLGTKKSITKFITTHLNEA